MYKRQAKIDKKLRIIELQLKKQKLDQDAKAGNDNTLDMTDYVISDRNSLLDKLKKMDK